MLKAGTNIRQRALGGEWHAISASDFIAKPFVNIHFKSSRYSSAPVTADEPQKQVK